MDAEFDGGGGGGVWSETPLDFACRPDQQEERVQEALQLVSAATAHLRRRLRAMELKMESTHDASVAAADALGRQVARMERLEGKMAAVERRVQNAMLHLHDDDDDGGSDCDDLSGLSVASTSGDEYPACPGCGSSSSRVFSRCASAASSFTVDDGVVSQASCLDSTSQVDVNVDTARVFLKRHLGGLRLDSSSLSSKAAVDVPIPKTFLDSSAHTAPKVSKKQMSSVRSSFSRRFCDHLLDPSSFSFTADVSSRNQETPHLDSTIHTASNVPDENTNSPRNSVIGRLRGLLLDSSELSTAAVDTSIPKASTLSEKLSYLARSSFSRRPCEVLWNSSSKSSTTAAVYPNQGTSRLDSTIQTGPTISVKHVHTARSTFSHRHRGPNLDSASVPITAGNTFPNQKASSLGATTQTTVISNEHTSPAPSVLLRRLCRHILNSISALDTTGRDFPNRESLRLDCASQAASTDTDDLQKPTNLTRQFCRQLSDSLGSSTAASCTSFLQDSRLESTAEVPYVSDKRISSTSPFAHNISSHFLDSSSRSVAAPSSAIPKASNSKNVAEIPLIDSDNHVSSAHTSLSNGLCKVLRSAAALAGSSFAFSVEPISHLTPNSASRADTDKELRQSSEKSSSVPYTLSSPARDVAFESTACSCSKPFNGTIRASASTQTDGPVVMGSCGYLTQAPQSRMLYTSGFVTSEGEKFPKSESISRRCSSIECHCPSTAGAQKSLSGCYTTERVSQATSCDTFSNTNIASSSGFYDWEDNSQLSSVSGYDEPSQSSSCYPYSERVTQRLVWVSPPCNAPLYYCVPLVNSSFYRVYCHEDAADKNTDPSGAPWFGSKPQSCVPPCDVVPPVPSAANEPKFSSGSAGLSYSPHRFQTTPVTSSDVTNCCTTCDSKPISELRHTERSTLKPDDLMPFPEPNSSFLAVNSASLNSISNNNQTVIQTGDCLISSPKSPSCSTPLAGVRPTKVNKRSASLVRKSDSTCSLLSSCTASRPTSSGLCAQVTPSCSSNLGSSKHSSESKLHSTSIPTPPSSQSNSLDRITQLSEKVSCSVTSVSKNMQESTCDEPSICSPDVSLSISQPSSHSPSHDISYIPLVSDSNSSNILDTPVTLHQSVSAPFDDETTASKCSLRSSCPPDIIVTTRRPSSTPESSALIARVSSALASPNVTSHATSRSSSQIPPAPRPTPRNHAFHSKEVNCSCVARALKTISSTTSISSRAVATPLTCSTCQPPSDGILPGETSKDMPSHVRHFSSKTVILPKNIIRPHIPYIDSPILRPLSGCVSIKESNRPFSGHPVQKDISETTFVIDSPKSSSRPCVSSSFNPIHRPNSSSIRTGRARPCPFSARKLVSEATFVVDSPKHIVRPAVSCDDSKLIRRPANLDLAPPTRGAFSKARPQPHSVVSLMDLPSCARGDLPAARTAAIVGANASAPPVKVARSRSAEVKLGRRLLKAAQEGRAPAVRKLLDEGADINFTFATKWTALHRAVKMGHEEVVCALLDGGADVEARTSYDFTALHIAAYYDHKGLCLARLIDAGSVLGSKNRSGKTPLHYASEIGNKMAVRALLVAGANTSSLDDDGKTPYDVAKVDDVRGLLASASSGQKGVVRAG